MVASVLATTGELARVAGPGLRTHIGDVLPLIIDAIQDSAGGNKRLTAVSTLGQVGAGLIQFSEKCLPQICNHYCQIICENLSANVKFAHARNYLACSLRLTWLSQVVESTGLVMTPYLEYPQLLSVLLRMLNEGEGSPHIRREVLKVDALFCASRCPSVT